MDICRMFADICMYRKKNVTVASTGRRADICTRNGSLFQSYWECGSAVLGTPFTCIENIVPSHTKDSGSYSPSI